MGVREVLRLAAPPPVLPLCTERLTARDLMPGLIQRPRDDVHVGEIGVDNGEMLRGVRGRGGSRSFELVSLLGGWLKRTRVQKLES